MTALCKPILLLAGLTWGATAWADPTLDAGYDPVSQESPDDELDDILGTGPTESTTAEEKRDVIAGRIDDQPGTDVDLPDEDKGRRIIKSLQRKNFLKIGRFEISPHLGFVTNDPFINRYLGGAGLGYHLTEIFAIELQGSFSPDFGESDWKPITDQLVNENKVSPDISKIVWYGNVNFQFSPIYGKIAVGGKKIINFDIFGAFGTGVVHTQDDLRALQAEGEQSAEITKIQNHLNTSIGGGFRIIFSQSFAARLEGYSMTYIETIDSTVLEYKNNFLLLGSVSFFIPGMN